jgi:3',5'-cyclic AMP phosphodiesterase CpdA
MTIAMLHISDLHFGPPYVPRVGDALIEIAPTLDADVIVASGDFTQRAKREQFEQARAFLDRLPALPTMVVPGNHDVPLYRVRERFVDPYGLYRQYIAPELDAVHRLDGAVIVALNSTSPRRAITNGRIHLEQLDFCAEALRDEPEETVKIVVAHHHFLPAPDFERDRTMPKAQRALDRLIALKVDLILGGHLHRAYIGNSLDVYAGADREHGTIIVQCGTSTSRRGRGREREKNSFNLLHLDREGLQVTHYLFFEDTGAFAPVSRHQFPRPARGMFEAAAAHSAAGTSLFG